jgi:hypothetical protein
MIGDAFKYLERCRDESQDPRRELAKSAQQNTVLLKVLGLEVYVYQFADGSGIVWYRDNDEIAPFEKIENFWNIWKRAVKYGQNSDN